MLKVKIFPKLTEENPESLVKGTNMVIEDKIEMILRKANMDEEEYLKQQAEENKEEVKKDTAESSIQTHRDNTVLSGDELRKNNYDPHILHPSGPQEKEVILQDESDINLRKKKSPQRQNSLEGKQVLVNKNSREENRTTRQKTQSPGEFSNEITIKNKNAKIEEKISRERNLDIKDVKSRGEIGGDS